MTKSGLPSVWRVDRADELGRRRDAARRLDEAADVLPARGRAASTPLEEPLAGELGERLRERVPARELHVAVGADEEQAHARELARDELEQAQRSLVGPVQVVEHEHERLRPRGALQEGGERVEEAEARLLRVLERRRLGQIGQTLATSGTISRDLRRARAQLASGAARGRARGRSERSACTQGQ